jgi:hypothetical protein
MVMFIVVCAFVGLIASIVMFVKGSYVVGAVVLAIAAVVFFLRHDIADGAENDLDGAPVVNIN